MNQLTYLKIEETREKRGNKTFYIKQSVPVSNLKKNGRWTI